MPFRLFRPIFLLVVVAALGTLACDLSTIGISQASKPQVVIQSPATGSQFSEGENVTLQSTATDNAGVVRVELAVDGAIVRTDAPPIPQGQKSFTLIQSWQATAGTHILSVRAYNAAGAASEPALISINVTPAIAVLPTAALGVPTISSTTLLPTVPPNNATAAPTPVSATRTPTRPPASPTIAALPGVYAVSIRVDPAAPKRSQPLSFFVTFLNTKGTPLRYKWFVKVYEPDAKNSKGETPKVSNDIQVGTSELNSDVWKLTGPGACADFFARVFWIDTDSQEVHEFIKPDGSGGPAAGFQMCP